jgi:hypothetical protein
MEVPPVRLAWTVNGFTLLELVMLEQQPEPPPSGGDEVHDLSVGHDIGFSAPVGWTQAGECDDTQHHRTRP